MSRETAYATDHWAHANVVQEMGWRTQLARLPLPKGKREKAEPLDPGQTRLVVLFYVLHCMFLAWVTSLVGLHSMSGGSLPGESLFPVAAAVSAGLIVWVKSLRWPPVPEWDRFPNRARREDEAPEVDDVDAMAETETVEEDTEPLTVRDVLQLIVLLPLLAVAVALLLLGAFLALVAGYVVRRGWPALVVVALLAVVGPYASADDVGYTLFAAVAFTVLFNLFLVWPLQWWCRLPVPALRRRAAKGIWVQR